MKCSPFDVNDYFLEELASAQSVQVKVHLQQCAACQEELERLQVTRSALFSLRDEEIPQRIAFLSDPVFEPSPVRRWLGAFWGSTARLGFASAAMLSLSIFYFALTRPAPAPVVAVAVPTMTATPPVSLSQADMQRQIQQALAPVVAQMEARQADEIRLLTVNFERRYDEQRKSVQWLAEENEINLKHAKLNRVQAMVQPPERGIAAGDTGGEAK
jgi:anti-sigma factor RsiW